MKHAAKFFQADHFRREAKRMIAAGIGFPLLLAIIGALIMPAILAFLAADRCLDRGGRFDGAQQRCEFTTAEPQAVKVPAGYPGLRLSGLASA